jgi:hypothetical protein
MRWQLWHQRWRGHRRMSRWRIPKRHRRRVRWVHHHVIVTPHRVEGLLDRRNGRNWSTRRWHTKILRWRLSRHRKERSCIRFRFSVQMKREDRASRSGLSEGSKRVFIHKDTALHDAWCSGAGVVRRHVCRFGHRRCHRRKIRVDFFNLGYIIQMVGRGVHVHLRRCVVVG